MFPALVASGPTKCHVFRKEVMDIVQAALAAIQSLGVGALHPTLPYANGLHTEKAITSPRCAQLPLEAVLLVQALLFSKANIAQRKQYALTIQPFSNSQIICVDETGFDHVLAL